MVHSGTSEYFGHHFVYLIELAFVGVKFMVIHSIDADILLDISSGVVMLKFLHVSVL